MGMPGRGMIDFVNSISVSLDDDNNNATSVPGLDPTAANTMENYVLFECFKLSTKQFFNFTVVREGMKIFRLALACMIRELPLMTSAKIRIF